MQLKVAVLGFRHGHIYGVTQLLQGMREEAAPTAELVAVADEDPATLEQVRSQNLCSGVYTSYQQVLDEVPCDVVAIGEYYARRGPLAIEALQRGKHILSDKPLCIRLDEWEEIARLSREKGLSVACQFDMRGAGVFRGLRRLVQEGRLGEVHALSFEGQHPLMYGTRFGWYFEDGKHGGTINDLAIHALDYIPWLTGQRFQTVNAARNWNAAIKQEPGFRDGAQMMLTLENGAGVLGDVSYLTPDSFGYQLPHYWRTTVWGSKGMAVTSYGQGSITLFANGATEAEEVPADEGKPGLYFHEFVREINGEREGLELTTDEVLTSSRVALMTQYAADEGKCNIPLL